ncbi:MAG: hypothetical protein KF789_09790 [Bdellovibrionaceae bacterium]|nr:hypothetical protein [Pseudobdellovibrionaceae bacterium]
MKTMKCLNFSPRQTFESYAGKELERLMAIAPSDSEGQTRAFFDQDRFVVEAAISSTEGKFKSSVAVPIPRTHPKGREWQMAALDELFGDIERQLMKWRRKRFNDLPEKKAA